MIIEDIKVLYVTDKDNILPIRYDVIKSDDNTCHVKCFIEKNNADGFSAILVENFKITVEDYKKECVSSSFQQTVLSDYKPTSDAFINRKLQEHRNKLNLETGKAIS
ncbi:hypothetical protein PT300_13335 [Enterobacteriaceae bacterium ESL0689]|nr:hypothetical protein [Enterobacteriaceae bacterium ESL0689]